MGERSTRVLYVALVAGAFVAVPLVAGLGGRPLAALALAAVPFARKPAEIVLRGAKGPALIPVLGRTGQLGLLFGAAFALGLWLSGLG